jgi:hypothetical protein
VLLEKAEMLVVPEIGEKEVSSRSEDALDFGEEILHVTVAMGGFYVHDHVEALIAEGKSFGIPGHEGETLEGIGLPAKGHNALRVVQSDQALDVQVSFDIIGSASSAAADLEDSLSVQGNRFGEVVIKLDGATVVFIRRI